MLSNVIKLYEDRHDVTLTTYVISDSPELLNGAARPAILICPGGAYLGCTDREAEPVALRFAAMGYHAFVLRYSVFFQGKKVARTPGVKHERKEHSVHPNPIRDIAKAMLIIRENEEEWKIDTEKIALCGFSAGAHNCAMYSVYWNTPLIYEYFHSEPEIFKPAATILGYTLSDYFLMKDCSREGMAKEIFELSNLALAGSQNPDDTTLNSISPALHVTDNTPPMYLWATSEDSSVPVEHTLRMATALSRKKIPFEVHVFETGDHGLSLANQASAGDIAQINADAANWIPMAENWLKKRFALKLRDKIQMKTGGN